MKPAFPPFEEIYRNHVDMVYNLCLHYLHRQQEAEEATQDVFLRVHDRLDSFQGRSSLQTWIYRIAIHHCLDRIKASRRQKRGLFVLTPLSNFLNPKGQLPASIEPVSLDHPGVKIEDQESLAQLFAHIHRLPERQHTALLLQAVQGHSLSEIADIMESSSKSVESLLSRARANLKKSLADAKDSSK